MSKIDRFDILLLQTKDSVLCASAPYGEANIGDLVTCDGGMGEVINKISWMSMDNEVVKFVEELIPVYEAETVYNRGYVKEDEANAEELE